MCIIKRKERDVSFLQKFIINVQYDKDINLKTIKIELCTLYKVNA